jgi:hypothetical protein
LGESMCQVPFMLSIKFFKNLVPKNGNQMILKSR